MNNSKRPIILTLTTTQESAVMRVTEKISSYFEVLRYTSPELYMTCKCQCLRAFINYCNAFFVRRWLVVDLLCS